MNTQALPEPSLGRAWSQTCLALALCAAVAMAWMPSPYAPAWNWQPDQLWARPWMPWSAPLLDAHRALWHANTALLVLLALCGHALQAGRREAVCLLLAWPLSTLGLLTWPELHLEGPMGLSGVVHAAGAIVIVHAMTQHPALGTLAAIGLIFKLVVEHAWQTPRAYDPLWGTSVTYALHLSGASTGAVLALLWPRKRPARTPPR